MNKKESYEITGDHHHSTSIKTPLRANAFEKSERKVIRDFS